LVFGIGDETGLGQFFEDVEYPSWVFRMEAVLGRGCDFGMIPHTIVIA
jgi:hypothetical protein